MLGRLPLTRAVIAEPPTRAERVVSVDPDERAENRASPAWSGFDVRIGGGVAYLVGVGILARAFIAEPTSAAAYVLFWSGLAACFVGAVALGCASGSRTRHRVLALALLGAILYAPAYLRSPAFPLFQDELLHIQSLQLMLDLKTRHIPYTFFQVPGDYPGLELVGLTTVYATGLPTDQVVRYVALVLHSAVPVVAFWALRACRLSPRLAFFGALIYIANHSYYFFHASFAYESQGILLYLLVATFALRIVQPARPGRVASAGLLLVSLLGVVVTHHVSGAMACGLLLTLSAAVVVIRRAWSSPLLEATIFGIVAWFGWLLFATDRTGNYLFGNLAERARATLSLFQGQESQTRQLFWNSPVPPVEQLFAYMYPLIVAGLIGYGLLRQLRVIRDGWRQDRRLHIGPVQVALMCFGPLAWLATAPLVVTRSADIIYRAWPFLFVGIGLCAAIAVEPLLKTLPSGRIRWAPLIGAHTIAGLVLAGSIILNDNHAGRFRPAELHSSVGPEALTEDVRSAARWLQSEDGRFHTVVGDAFNEIGFAVFGMQVTDVWSNWLPFYAQDPVQAQAYLDALHADYVVADWRDTRYLPRYAFYFNAAEYIDQRVMNVSREGTLLPADDLAKFDRMSRLWRVYDNGDIVIYQVQPPTDSEARGS